MEEQLGAPIRGRRLEVGLSSRDLAEKVNLTASFLTVSSAAGAQIFAAGSSSGNRECNLRTYRVFRSLHMTTPRTITNTNSMCSTISKIPILPTVLSNTMGPR